MDLLSDDRLTQISFPMYLPVNSGNLGKLLMRE